jgi:nucleoredoxin
MTGRWTLFIAVALALAGSQLLIGADAALEKTVEKAKEKRQAEITKAGNVYHAAIERSNAAIGKAYELAIANAKRKKDDAKVEALTKDMEAVKEGGTPELTETGDKALDGALKKRTIDLATAEKAYKSAVERANTSLESQYNIAISAYKRKSDSRADELTTEIAAIKAEEISPTKTETAEKGGKGSQELIKTIGEKLVNADGKDVSSKVLGSKEYVPVYFSASWCPPCRAFTPSLVKFHNDYAKEGKFEVLLVGSDQSEKDMLGYMEEDKMPWLGVPFNSNGANALKQAHNVTGIPKLVVLDKEGKVVSSPGGASAVLAEFKKTIGAK